MLDSSFSPIIQSVWRCIFGGRYVDIDRYTFFLKVELTGNYHLVPCSSKDLLLNIYHPHKTSQIQLLVYNSQQRQDTDATKKKKTLPSKENPVFLSLLLVLPVICVQDSLTDSSCPELTEVTGNEFREGEDNGQQGEKNCLLCDLE